MPTAAAYEVKLGSCPIDRGSLGEGGGCAITSRAAAAIGALGLPCPWSLLAPWGGRLYRYGCPLRQRHRGHTEKQGHPRSAELSSARITIPPLRR